MRFEIRKDVTVEEVEKALTEAETSDESDEVMRIRLAHQLMTPESAQAYEKDLRELEELDARFNAEGEAFVAELERLAKP